MKKLSTSDLGLFSRIVSKMDIRKEVSSMFKTITIEPPERPENMGDEEYQEYLEAFVSEKMDEANKEMMANLLILLIENYHKAENEVYKLLGKLSDRTVEEVSNLPLKRFIELLKELMEDESIGDFFNLVAK